jgi:mannose-6-phosphate isomerase
MEVQEPTDITLRSERITPDGKRLDDKLCHYGAGFDAMLECFDYVPRSLEETLAALRIQPRSLWSLPGCEAVELIGPRTTDLFGMRRLVATGQAELPLADSYSVLIVVSGRGFLGAARHPAKPGDRFFVPAARKQLAVETAGGNPLELIECSPG